MTNEAQHRPVVVVEDSDDDFSVLYRLLQTIDPQAGLLRFRAGPPFLQALNQGLIGEASYVLMDQNLPGMHGLAVVRQVRAMAKWACLPIIVLSGSTRTDDVRQAHLAGANSYMIKPLDPRQYRDRLQTLHRYWRDVAEHPPNGPQRPTHTSLLPCPP